MSKLRVIYHNWGPVTELIVAAALWGFGFVATKWALESLDVFELTFMRFILAALVGLPFLLVRQSRLQFRHLLRLSFMPALFLVSTLTLQTWGLLYTTATKSGFITTLYVVLVPILEAFLLRRRLPPGLWLCVVAAFVGMCLIVGVGFGPANVGDALTLLCAFTAAGQIYWMGLVSPMVDRPFAFNIYQCLWAVLFSFPFIHVQALCVKIGHVAQWSPLALLGFLSLGVGSTVIAFYLQVRAQSRLSPTVSSLMFLLESPFALVFAMLWLGEKLSLLEATGAVVIFASALLATTLESRKESLIFKSNS